MVKYPRNVQSVLDSLRKEKGKYLEIKVIDDRYCVYHATSEWDSENKKVVKRTYYMGVIRPDGTFVTKGVRKKFTESRREIFEYGNSALAYTYLRPVKDILEKEFPYTVELIAMAIIIATNPQPLRLMESAWEKLYLSKEISPNLNPNHISRILGEVGKRPSIFYDVFSKLTKENDVLFYDLTAIFTHSNELNIAERGYNPDHIYQDQINVVMAFSRPQQQPIGIDVFFGSMRDIITIKDFIQRYRRKNVSFVVDRGFFSYKLFDELNENDIHYLAVVEKDAKIIDYTLRLDKGFIYRDRPIRWNRMKTEYGWLYLFEDPTLKGSQESVALRNIIKEQKPMEEFEIKRIRAGIFPLLSDIDLEGEEAFKMYKSREDVELCFDIMKNNLQVDKTYLRDYDKIRGYFFVAFLATKVHFEILRRLREKDIVSKISIKEVLFELSKWFKIVEKNGMEYHAKTTKKTRKIVELFEDKLMGYS